MSEILVVTSLCVSDEMPELPFAIKSAFEFHAVEGLIREVHIFTESDERLVTRLISKAISIDKFKVFQTDERPTLAILFEHASKCIETSGGRAAIMNADISFAGSADISRCLTSLDRFSIKSEQPVYALMRHDSSGEEWVISLYEECGLPNLLSTDCWIISRPIVLRTADFYSLGEMNCDLMLNYDLIAVGHDIFNPCLDVCIRHHERDTKSNEYYLAQSRMVGTRECLSRFMQLRHNPSFVHYGVPWVSTEWLICGYRPKPYSNRTKKLFVRVSAAEPVGLPPGMKDIEEFANRNSFDLILLADGSADNLFTASKKLLLENSRVYILKLSVPFDCFLDQLLASGRDGHFCISFASNAGFLSDELASVSGFIILDEKLRPGVRAAKARELDLRNPQPGKSERHDVNSAIL